MEITKPFTLNLSKYSIGSLSVGQAWSDAENNWEPLGIIIAFDGVFQDEDGFVIHGRYVPVAECKLFEGEE